MLIAHDKISLHMLSPALEQTAHVQADLGICSLHMANGNFYHAAAPIANH